MRFILVTLLVVLFSWRDEPEATAPSRPVIGLSGSVHDFSGESWSGGDKCAACHDPAPEEPLPESPLWNPSADFNQAFADSLPDAAHRRDQVGAGSIVCMRCHDGTVARDMFGGLTSRQDSNAVHTGLWTTAHGGTNHPVGVEYPKFDPEYRPVNAILSEGRVRLPDGKVECISCHDPHNEWGVEHMLAKPNDRSALCLTCHKK